MLSPMKMKINNFEEIKNTPLLSSEYYTLVEDEIYIEQSDGK